MPSSIPDDLRRFILTSVPSVPFVEALLLFRTMGDGLLTPATLARRLYIGEGDATRLMQQLHHVGVIAPADDAYRYAPADPGLASALDDLATYYASHLIEVTELIHSTTARRANEFADAFRLKKER